MAKPDEDDPFTPDPVTLLERQLIGFVDKKDFEKGDVLLEEIRKAGLGNMDELDKLYLKIKKYPWVQGYRDNLISS